MLPHRSLWQLSQKHGPIMLFHLGSVPALLISSGNMAREILKTHDHVFCTRPVLEGFRKHLYDFKDVALAPYGEYWRQMRKTSVLELLSTKRVQSFQSVRVQEVEHMINSISVKASCVVNLTEKLNNLIHTIIQRIVLGVSYEGKKTDYGGNFAELIHGAISLMAASTVVSYTPYIGGIIALFTGLQTKLEKNFNELDKLLQQAIDEHSDPERQTQEHKDIVDVLLRVESDQLGEIGFRKDHIKAILMDMYLDATETTTETLVWAMPELAKNPRVMKKVQDEVRRCVGKKKKVDGKDLDQLHYLTMVMKEVLRLHPPGAILLPRECMSHCNIYGYDIYPKTWVIVNVWTIGRDPDSWKDPEVFFPERFIDCLIDFRGQDFDFLPFGAGRRGCPGISMGTAIMELALANLIYCFNWELPLGLKIEDLEMDETGIFVIKKKSALRLVPIKYDWGSSKENFF
ncbi:hypothetical protein GIB67_030982 [Kingdonia uniflora]|uniref:Cytochrome P450 n=1 Tax=Kingdonia uniflora TaxID=39325 RepID=A0A7J7L3T0_9MAGN|nr:hypothetical protein GIB67_030982 [Kingdonia uniflora]